MGGYEVNVISYRLGDRYVCGIDNIDPGATICRATGGTRRVAMEKALSQAALNLREHTYLAVPEQSNQVQALDKLVLQDDPPHTYGVSDFLQLPLAERMNQILSGNLAFYDPFGQQIPSGEAMRLLKQASEAQTFIA